MSDEQPDKSEQTEDPSERKLSEARRKGDVAKSQEVTTWFMMLGSALLFLVMAPVSTSALSGQLMLLMANSDQFHIGDAGFAHFFSGLSQALILIILVPLAIMTIFAIAANLVQHQPLFSAEPIKPKLSKISLIQGSKRLFSGEALVNFAKGLIKLTIVGLVVFFSVWSERDQLDTMMTMDMSVLLNTFQFIALKIFAATLAVVTVIAIADFLYQRNKWWEKQKMTMREVKDEHKNMEGDPQVKARIRQLRQERSRQRMMADVPDSTVVITNPTHFAVALKYEKGMAAPKCLAKGADAIAFRIREMAKSHDVPIVENPPLARALFASVEIGDDIPAEHFKAVAQVIGYVMRLQAKAKQSWRGSGAGA